MLKIRDFAEIAQVPTSTLRYYDEIGLFKPASVDPETGYRFYSIEQLLRLNRILALRDVGLDLAQIAVLLKEPVSTEALEGMLRLQQVKLEQQIQAEQEQLARIEARLNYLQTEGRKLADQVVLKAVKPFAVLASYTHVTGFFPNVAYTNTLLTLLSQHEIKPSGPILYLYHERAADTEDLDVEVAVPVERTAVRGLTLSAHLDGEITLRELPEVPKMASVLYQGSPLAIVEAYQALGAWIQAHGLTIGGPGRKVCLRWSGEFSDYLTEIQFPVEVATPDGAFTKGAE